ncbi:hypothetical protein [Blastococcus mobilis]|uniref:hypothetical protein n=1 Tax=Blastococcus mobilis TaxID=1938746 RepID=UPI0034A0BF6A
MHPVLLGRGQPLFGPADTQRELRLVETRTFGNGVVLLRHERPADGHVIPGDIDGGGPGGEPSRS